MITGREKEKKILDVVLNSSEAEFVAIYGRRRVGKTYLIREFFKDKGTYLEITGRKDGNLKVQLESFISAFKGMIGSPYRLKSPENWKETFELITHYIEGLGKNKKMILFLDELPWLTTPRSDLIQELDYFWNTKWSRLKSLILIVCGSAASWMLEKLIYAKGGLHNRISKTILLEPFNLKETQTYFQSKGVLLDTFQVTEIYMVTGGIPFYLNQVKKGKSPTQIINELCFKKDGLLYDEFNRVYQSLFLKEEKHIKIVRAIAQKRQGISREELIKKTGITSGGAINRPLDELVSSGFIEKYLPYQKTSHDPYYRIIDEYSIFYLKWIEKIRQKNFKIPSNYWHMQAQSAAWNSWAGYTFETICQKHVDKILEAMGISGIACDVGTWRYFPKNTSEQGVQIDLLFDRADRIITLCEIKFSKTEYLIDKNDANNLRNKISIFKEKTKTKKMINMAMVSTMGLKQNMYSDELIIKSISLEQLF